LKDSFTLLLLLLYLWYGLGRTPEGPQNKSGVVQICRTSSSYRNRTPIPWVVQAAN
jgi:hypothetical protein